MEELIERVSDIAKSPVILGIWQHRYRQGFKFCLAVLLIFFLAPVVAQEDRVTRFEFISGVYERIYNRRLTEIEAVNSGLLDHFDDGSFHLDWPVSRGMAAMAFYRLHVQCGSAAKLPRAFADIGAESNFRKPLEVVGGAFLPLKKGRFDPNYLLDRQTVYHATRVLLEKEVLKQEDRSEMKEIPQVDPVITTVAGTASFDISPINPDLGFKEKKSSDGLFRASAFQRLAKARSGITAGQINPQTMSSIEDAVAAMTDVESILERLGGSVMEMTSTYPSNPDDEAVLRKGLAQIENVLSVVLNRFEYAKIQLTTVMPVDPDQVQKCEELNSRLLQRMDQVQLLKKRIAARLAEPQKEGQP